MNAEQGLKQKPATPAKPPCPYCGLTHTIRKEIRLNKRIPPVRTFLCKSCSKRFSENRTETRELPGNIAEKYLLDFKSLTAVLNNTNLGISRTTLHRRIIEQARKTPDWDELLKTMKGKRNWGFVMGIDTSGLKIRGKNYVYLHVADVTSHDPIAYAICRNEDAATVEPILRKLRHLGYSPTIVVSDLAQELLTSVRRVSPCAIIQGCIFHVRLGLEKDLPTKKGIKKIGLEKVALWRKVKELVNYACISKNEETRQQYLNKLKDLNLDEKAKNVVEQFLKNLKYYHTMDEDEFKGFGPNILYNNQCECDIRLIKDLKKQMKGFKSVESAQAILKLFWFIKRKNLTSLPEKEENPSARREPEKEDISEYPSLLCYVDGANLDKISEASGVSREVLTKTVQETGRTVVGDFAFTETKLNDMRNRILKMKEKSLKAIMQEIGYDQPTTEKLLNKFGAKFLYKSFDPSDIYVQIV